MSAPLPHVVQIVNEAMAAAGPDGKALFKWTCGGCHQRVTFMQFNTVYMSAKHDEPQCGYVTDINNLACELGYALVLKVPKDTDVDQLLRDSIQRRDAKRNRN